MYDTVYSYNEILGLIQDDITKTNTNMLDSIPANVKSTATIPFLATGDVKLFC